MTHAIDQILAAVESQLAGIAGSLGVHRKPFHLLDESDLDCIVIDDIADETKEVVGLWPRTETHELQFDVIPLVMATAETSLPLLGDLHGAVESRLFGSKGAIKLNGLLNMPILRPSATFFSDSESLQKPVCGWRIRVSCIYHTRSDLPGIFDRG